MLDRVVKTIVRRNNTDALRAHLEALAHYPALTGTLKRLPCLSLVISGDDDPLVSAEGIAEMARICGSREKSLPGIGHSITAEAPDQLAELVERFFAADI